MFVGGMWLVVGLWLSGVVCGWFVVEWSGLWLVCKMVREKKALGRSRRDEQIKTEKKVHTTDSKQKK